MRDAIENDDDPSPSEKDRSDLIERYAKPFYDQIENDLNSADQDEVLQGKTAWEAMKPFVEGLIADLWDRTPQEQLVEVYEKLVEPTLIDPVFVTSVPSVVIPLARPNEEDPYFADVYELVINGQEISPGYTELNDPDVQAELFRQQVGDEAEKQDVDEDFLHSLKVGMPPAGGMGLGVDRLVMMLTGAESIRDVLLFPLMKPVADETKRRRDEETQ
jgi:lysyl-tRNA synthetase class II